MYIDTWERTAADSFVAALSTDKVSRLDARNRGLLILTVAAGALVGAATTLLSTVSTLCVSITRRVRQRAAGNFSAISARLLTHEES